MTKATKAAERMMNERGYVVVGIQKDAPTPNSGVDVVATWAGSPLDEDRLLVLRCETTLADWDAQLKSLSARGVRDSERNPEDFRFFRATLSEHVSIGGAE